MLAQLLWHSLNMLPAVVALGAALLFAVAWLYPSQVRRVRWPWRWVLPGLRVAGLLALTVSLLQPTLQRPGRAAERGEVLVLVDRSRSMSVTDLTRTPAQLVSLADGLGRLPPGVRAADTAGLAAALERLRERVADVVSAANDAEAAEAFGRGIDSARARLAAARGVLGREGDDLAARAASMPAAGELSERLRALADVAGTASATAPPRDAWAADARARIDAAHAAVAALQAERDGALYASNAQVKAACDGLARLSRWSLVEQALLQPGTGLVARAAGEAPLAGYALAGDAVAMPLPRAPVDGDDAGARLPATPDGTGSDVVGGVAAALADAGSRVVRAVVLFSDGRQVGGDAAIVAGLAPAGAPVFAVGVTPPGVRPLDLAFARDVSVPASAFAGETVTVRAALNAIGMPPNAAVDVQLQAGGVARSQRVQLKPDGSAAPVEFSLRLDQGGPQRLVLSVPPAPGEITAENNVVERWVKVFPRRIKVAAFAGTPGWDFQLLRDALARAPWVQLDAAVLDPLAPKVALSAEQLLGRSVLIFSDVAAGALDDVQWDAVNRLVRERGGSLFLIAGPDHLPASYTPETIVPSSLLPFDVRDFRPSWRTWPGEQPAFRFTPAAALDAEAADALRLGPGAGSVAAWQSLGGAFRFMPVPELNPRVNTRALLVEADSRLPVLTEATPGNGRVFFVGMNETWRWRPAAGGRDFERFWLQLVRYAAGEPYAAQHESFALDVDDAAPAPGEPVTVRARVFAKNAGAYRVQVLRDGQTIQTHELTPAGPAGSGRYTAPIPALPAGDYTLRLLNSGNDDPAAPPLDVPLHVATTLEAEMVDVSGDDGLLRRIAAASGGRFLTLDELGELPPLLAHAGQTRSRYAELRLWDGPLLFLFVVACFGGEWALRKRLGLA